MKCIDRNALLMDVLLFSYSLSLSLFSSLKKCVRGSRRHDGWGVGVDKTFY